MKCASLVTDYSAAPPAASTTILFKLIDIDDRRGRRNARPLLRTVNEGTADERTSTRPRELTGRMVLLWLVAFFGVVFAVNARAGAAPRSRPSAALETHSSYKAGLHFEQDVAAAERQDALHWQVERQARARRRPAKPCSMSPHATPTARRLRV